jgi:autotransporter-associated beta strand protein
LIGIADSGLDSRHSEYLGRVLPGYNFSTDKPLEPGTNSDFTPRGTHVTGIAAAERDGKGMHGVAVDAQIVPAKLGSRRRRRLWLGLFNVGKAVRGPVQFVAGLETDTKGRSGTFSNDISGAGGLTKRGEGSLTLTGRNSYAGGTAVLGGTLIVDGMLASDVTAGQGTTLRGIEGEAATSSRRCSARPSRRSLPPAGFRAASPASTSRRRAWPRARASTRSIARPAWRWW